MSYSPLPIVGADLPGSSVSRSEGVCWFGD